MTRFAIVFLAGFAAMFAAAGAQACRAPRSPVVPLHDNYDAVALTTVVGGDAYGADLRIDAVLDGRTARAPVHVEYGDRPDGIVVTSCGLPGPPVRRGERVVLVYGRARGERFLMGWTTFDYAAQVDEFFARYRAARAAPARRRLLARWRRVNRARGPVPLTDPEHWLPPHAGALGWSGQEDGNTVNFRVADDGRIAECYPHRGDSTPRSDAICAGISARRFLPPIFERERSGIFRLRWNGP